MLGFPNEETALFIPSLEDFFRLDLVNIEYGFLVLYQKIRQYFSENVKHTSFISLY